MPAAEKDYLAIAAKRCYRPGDFEGFRKIFVYGRNKKGKTRFSLSMGIDRTLILDPEDGTATMQGLRPFVWPIASWKDTQDAYGALRTGLLSPNHLVQGESSTPFDWVSVDGLTRMNNMALRFVMRQEEQRDLDRQPGFVQQRDYGKSGELMKQFLHNFHTLKINVIWTSQERMMTGLVSEGDEEDDRAFFMPDLPAAVRGTVNSLAEVIGRIYSVKAEVKNKEVIQRRLWIGLHERYDTGYRSDFVLPDMIKYPTLPKLIKLMLEGGNNG